MKTFIATFIVTLAALAIFRLNSIAPSIRATFSSDTYLNRHTKYQITLLILAGIVLVLTYFQNPENFKLLFSIGNISAPAEPVSWFGIGLDRSWIYVGFYLCILITMGTLTFVYLQFRHLKMSITYVLPYLGWILLFSFANSFSEEAIFRLGIIVPALGHIDASYIVLIILAGPGLVDLGLPLLTAHMIVFWYSQDANVTPPVALESFAASGIAGSSPMRTAFTSWKLAKGLYIMPIIMAYHPLLLNGPTWDVIRTVIFSIFAITAFVVCMERYFLTRLSWAETILQGAAAVALIWNHTAANYMGGLLFIILLLYQIMIRKRTGPELVKGVNILPAADQ